MDVVSAFYDVGSYRGAAEMCGVDPKTVKRKVLAHEAGVLDEQRAGRRPVAKNTDVVRDLVAKRVDDTHAKVTAKRLLPEARAGGYEGSDRNFRRLVAAEKKRKRKSSGVRHTRYFARTFCPSGEPLRHGNRLAGSLLLSHPRTRGHYRHGPVPAHDRLFYRQADR